MKKIIFTALLSIFALGAFAQNHLIYSTTFPAGDAPLGWSTQILGFEGETDWYFGDTYLPGTTSFSTPAAIFNDDISFDEHSNVRLISPAFDVTGYETVTLSFDYGLSRTNNGLGTLDIQIYDGDSWVEIMFIEAHTPPVSSGAIDVTQYKNSQFQVRYTYDDEYGSSWGAGVANFLLEGTYDVVPNNEIENAFALTCGQTILGTTNTSTAKTGLPVCNDVDGNTHGVWYKFEDTMFQSSVNLSLCESEEGFDTRLSVFKGDISALTCVTANDNTCGDLSSVSFDYDGYSDYYVLVSGEGETTGDFTISATCEPILPPNDEIANAYDVDTFAQPYTDHAVQFMYATSESQAFDYTVNGCDSGGMPYVWYKFTAEADGTARVTLPTPSPGGLNLIHFYTAPNENATIPDIYWVNQASNACNVFDDDRQIDITQGTTYYVCITLEGGNSDVDFIITYNVPCEAPIAPTAEDQAHCQGATVASLIATGIEGNQIKWYATLDGEPLEDTVALETGLYYVTQSIETCESEAVSIMVTVNPIPDAPDGSDTQQFAAGETVGDLEVNAEEGAILNWYVLNDDEYTSIASGTVLEDGVTYYVSQTVNNCPSAFFGITANLTAGINDLVYSKLKVYPNPANGIINITNGTAISKVTVTNLLGQTVITRTTDTSEVQLNLSSLQQGTYILNLESEGSPASVKIVKL